MDYCWTTITRDSDEYEITCECGWTDVAYDYDDAVSAAWSHKN